MQIDSGKPLIANSADGLGIRCGSGPHDDIPLTLTDEVVPETGGMSVAPEWRALPDYRIPRRLREKHPSAAGKNTTACWRMGVGSFTEEAVSDGLYLRIDSKTHGLVEPSSRMLLPTYLEKLAFTADQWMIDED
jgi:hypothetical protein